MPAHDELDAWDFPLPDGLIARHPPPSRGDSRLLHVPLSGDGCASHPFNALPTLLRPGDLLVANDTRVMAARVRARRSTGGQVELLLLEAGPGAVSALARPARKLKTGDMLTLAGGGHGEIVAEATDGVVQVRLDRDPEQVMAEQGELPLPPYLGRDAEPADTDRYQTLFAGPLGAAAAPTAGLHFTPGLVAALRDRGIATHTLTLHVGLGTFRTLRPADIDAGELHPERYAITVDLVRAVADTRARGGRVIAVGTTSARALEAATPEGERLPESGSGTTRLFIQPGYRFRSVDGLVTNFHLPKSSLLMLVAALSGRERLLEAYASAIERRFRFYSYGDAMLLV